MVYNVKHLFWLGHHHVAVHEDSGDALMHTGENGCAWESLSLADGRHDGKEHTHGDVRHEMAVRRGVSKPLGVSMT